MIKFLKSKNHFPPYSREAYDMLTTFIDSAEVGLYVTDYHTCEVLLVNRKLAYYAGTTAVKDIVGKPCWMNLSPEDRTQRCSFCPYEKLIDSEGNLLEPYVWELYLEPLDVWLKVFSQAVSWTDGRLAHVVTFYDITESKRMREQLADLAFKDRLLGLKNEASLELDLLESDTKPDMILFDILSMQKVNEAYGREFGDQLLCSIRDYIFGLNLTDCELYRIGGDEFCITMRHVGSEASKRFAYTFSRRFTEPWILKHEGVGLKVFCMASIAVVPSEYISDREPILELTERTFKIAKEQKRIVIYDELINNAHKEQLLMEFCLKKCVREDMEGFEVYYQPIADPDSGIWCGIEALCRWTSPECGSVPPLLFVPEAERLGLIGTLGIWVLDTAVRECKKMGLHKHDRFILDVNVSALQFMDESLFEMVTQILEDNDYPGEKLCLEITESTRFTFTDQSLNTINRLREYGILVSLDDFGTGYSSFNNLKNLPVDIVKIERDFVKDIEINEYHQYLFHVIAELVHITNKKLIVEGVEYNVQKDILVNNGADLLQGYLFGKPMPSDELEKRLFHFYESKHPLK